MNKGVIIAYSIKSIIAIVICLALFWLLIRKGRFFEYDTIRDLAWREWAASHERVLDKISWIVAILLLMSIFIINIPIIKDVPYMLNGGYLTAEGRVQNDALGGAAGRVQEREFAILDDKTGEKLHFVTLSTGLKEGEYVKVTYLPNSHLATINYRN